MARFPYREVIELYSTGMSMKKVAYLCGIGINKARDVLVSSNPSRYQQLVPKRVTTQWAGRVSQGLLTAGPLVGAPPLCCAVALGLSLLAV